MKPFENNVTSLWIFGSMIISWSCACSETLSGPCEWRKLQREYERKNLYFDFFIDMKPRFRFQSEDTVLKFMQFGVDKALWCTFHSSK